MHHPRVTVCDSKTLSRIIVPFIFGTSNLLTSLQRLYLHGNTLATFVILLFSVKERDMHSFGKLILVIRLEKTVTWFECYDAPSMLSH